MMFVIMQCCVSSYQFLYSSGSQPQVAQGREGSDVGSRECFMDNSIIMQTKIKICLTSTGMSYLSKYLFLACFLFSIVPKILDLTSSIKN
jgi:hypothetical protein